jgi:hypothetical protein
MPALTEAAGKPCKGEFGYLKFEIWNLEFAYLEFHPLEFHPLEF